MSEQGQTREVWATKLGLILAMAGNAVGLGNFLRFPAQAARFDGGAFIIPYLTALIFLAMPLMWVEWAIGRYGGVRGHGTLPGIFPLMWKNKYAKYFGVMGVFLPLTINIYYVCVESWTMAYSYFSISGAYNGILDHAQMKTFFGNFLGANMANGVGGYKTTYLFFLIVIVLNIAIMYRGIVRGIELLAKVAMPLLFVFAALLMVRVLTIGAPDPVNHPDWSVLKGLGLIWNPNFKLLWDAKIWLAAAGQVFFTLSLGYGAIQCYASYLRENDDLVLSGLSTAATNEFVEIIFGGTIAIPIAFAFFGPMLTKQIAAEGAFSLGFYAMPIIFQKIMFGKILGALWFLLLFFAAITSSVALAQPAVSFLQDELKIPRERAVVMVWIFIFICAHFVIFGNGVLEEMDYWAGTFGIAFLGFAEIIIFMWVFGAKNAWDEINKGAIVRLPDFFKPIMTYLTPVASLALLVAWTVQEFWKNLTMKEAKPEQVKWLLTARGVMLVTFGLLLYLVALSGKMKKRDEEEERE